MSAADLLEALLTPDDVWEAAEREREAQMAATALERAFVAKWLPIWRQWGVTQPGYEHLLAKSPTS